MNERAPRDLPAGRRPLDNRDLTGPREVAVNRDVPAKREGEDETVRPFFPKPVVRERRWTRWLVWIVPILAAIAAFFYYRTYMADLGPEVTLRFASAEGLRLKETKVMYRGVVVGHVTEISLSQDRKSALVRVQMHRNQEVFAREGAAFWVVKPEVSETGLQGFGTFLSGPYIESTPGSGKEVTEIRALEKPPQGFPEGVNLTLYAPQIVHLQEHSPIYYRGFEVGEVRDIRLSPQSDHVEARIVIKSRYAHLLREHTHFWGMSGFDFKAGLFSGIDVKLEPLRALIAGAVGMATPPEKDMGGPVKDGARFALESDAPSDWVKWAPHLPIRPESGHEADGGSRGEVELSQVAKSAK